MEATFSPANWNVAQVVTVSAVDDPEEEGSHTATITHVASQAPANCIEARTLVVSIIDNDQTTLGHLEIVRFLDSVRLAFDSVPTHYYQIEHCATLASPAWQVLTNNVPGDGTLLEIRDSIDHTARFYRLMKRPSPWP